MTQEQKTKISEHFDELHAIVSDYGLNVPNDIRDALRAAYLAGADYALDIYSPHWISVEDEYPKEEQLVLACNTKGFFMPAKYSDGIWWFYWNLKSQLLDVVYWMPMPTLPNDYLAEASKEAHRIILEKQPKGGEE